MVLQNYRNSRDCKDVPVIMEGEVEGFVAKGIC
jgi:hypothetical protein